MRISYESEILAACNISWGKILSGKRMIQQALRSYWVLVLLIFLKLFVCLFYRLRNACRGKAF